jgi:hypothetical protein
VRRYVALVVVIAVLGGLAWWRCRGDETSPTTTVTADAGARASVLRKPSRPVDPRTIVRAAITGTVGTDRGPLAGVRVCVRGEAAELPDELFREPACATTDVRGAYAIEGLFPAAYYATAVLRGFEPLTWGEPREAQLIRIRANERRAGIDFTLRPGGVELGGTVADLTGGPIDKATVKAMGSVTETDDKGAFSLWVKPGTIEIAASADGYADATDDVFVPNGKLEPVRVELVLTPEATLAGTVIDAVSREPVAGARVMVGRSTWGWDDGETTFSDAQGKFRVGKLVPKRYVVTARTSTGFGKTASVLVGLAQTIEGVTVELHPAFRIDGRIVDAATRADCDRRALVALQDRATNKFFDLQRSADGNHFVDGVLPGTYGVTIYCAGARIRESYPPIAITDRDALGLIWEVDRGAMLRGRITARGMPVEAATISAERQGAGPRDKHTGGGTASRDDGSFEIAGLAAGTYKVAVSAERQIVARETFTVELVDNAVVEHDVALSPEASGTIIGTVVDTDGKLLGDAEVTATSLTGKSTSATSDKTGTSGAFTIGPLRPGDYKLTAYARDTALRKAGTTDDTHQGERVTVLSGQPSTVKLIVEAQTGVIQGSVVDSTGAPVSDAFLSAVRESDAAGAARSGGFQTRWSWNDRPVLTAMDGTFTLTRLSPGTYTIRAYRRGGGEAIADKVALGTRTKLTIQTTATISGRVREASGAAPDDFAITIRELTTGFRRREELFRTGGVYTLRDLPRGTYIVIAEAKTGIAQVELELRDGEVRSGVDLALDGFVTATGRVVEYGTGAPIAGITMSVRRVRGGGIYAASEGQDHISDAAGRFTVRNAPQGQVVVSGWGAEGQPFDIQVVRMLRGSGTVDLGDIEAIRRRLKPGDIAGELGLKFAEQTFDTPPDKRERKISYIDPKGPAAQSKLEVGDVVTSIDGIDVRNEHASRAAALIAAPPGTKVVLTVARGLTATIVLAAP